MRRAAVFTLLICLAVCVAGCHAATTGNCPSDKPAPAEPSVEEARAFMKAAEDGLLRLWIAAAGLLLAVTVAYWIRGGPGSVGPGNGLPVAQAPTDGGAADGMDLAATDALLRTSRNADLDLLSREMNELEAETVAATPSADVELDALEREFYDLVIEDGRMPGPGL